MRTSAIKAIVLCSVLAIALQSCAHLSEREAVREMRQASSVEIQEQERHAYVLNNMKEGRILDDPETRYEREAELDIFAVHISKALGRHRTMLEGYRVSSIMKNKKIDESRALQLLIDIASNEGVMNWMVVVLKDYGIPLELLSNELDKDSAISPFVGLDSDS